MANSKIGAFLASNAEKFRKEDLVSIQKKLEDADDAVWLKLQYAKFKNPTTTLLLSFIGLERFFLNDVILGIVKLITLYGYFFWGIIDIFTAKNRTKKFNLKEFNKICGQSEIATTNSSEAFKSEVFKAVQIISSSQNSDNFEDIKLLLVEKTDNEKRELLTKTFEQFVKPLLKDGVISLEDENKIKAFMNFFQLSAETLNKRGYYKELVKISILRDIANGELPKSEITIEGSNSFLLSKDEKLIWVFNGVMCFEDISKRVYQGGGAGMSFGLGKGTRVRMSSGRGQSVTKTELRVVGNGHLGLTNQALYYQTKEKSVKIPYSKINSVVAIDDVEVSVMGEYSSKNIIIQNGVCIYGDNSRNIFDNVDGDFACRVITGVRQL